LYQQWSDKYLGTAADPAAAPPADSSSKRTPLLRTVTDAIKSYLGGDNAAPPQEVDAALAATQAADPTASTAEVVQKTIAGTADPLSPNYMDQAGQDALGGLGRSSTAGQAPAKTGYDQTTQPTTSEGRAQALGAGAPAVPRELTRQDLINAGMSPGEAARVLEDNGAMVAAIGPKVSRFLPPGFLDDPYNRANLARFTTQRGAPMSGRDDAPVLGRDDYLMPGGNDGIYESLATKLINRADNRAAVAKEQARQAPRINPYYNPQVGYDSQNPPSREGTVIPQYDIPSGGGTAATAGGSSSNNKNTNSRSRGGARGRRSDAGDDTSVPGPQYAVADTGMMSDASNDVRSTLPAGSVAAATQAPQATGYANQAPSAGGFSGTAGNNVTTIPVRQGAPAAATPAAAAPAYPQGYTLAPTSDTTYDRAVVGPDGKVVSYVRKGDAPPSTQDLAGTLFNNNLGELDARMKRGDPVAVAAVQARATGQGGLDLSKPLPPEQAPTPASQAAAQAELAARAAGGRSAPGGQQSNDPVQDLLRRAAQTSDVNAQRMFTNEAYKIQETRRVNQQKSADAALKTFSTGEQNLIKSIYTKENGGNTLTPAEQALKDDYVTRIQQHSRSQQGGGQAAARAPTAQSTGAPVRVSSPAQARSLPSGTRIILPDGSPGIVP
jgi:hypothetical protein